MFTIRCARSARFPAVHLDCVVPESSGRRWSMHEGEPMMGTQTGTLPQVIPTSPFPVPRLAALARHATPHLLETTLIPLALFYGGLQLFRPWGALLARPGIRHFFQRVSLLWAGVFLANTGISLWLLVSQSLATFLWTRTVASLALTGLAIAASTWWFRHCVRATPAA